MGVTKALQIHNFFKKYSKKQKNKTVTSVLTDVTALICNLQAYHACIYKIYFISGGKVAFP